MCVSTICSHVVIIAVCGRRMGWCLQQKWVVPSAAATPSSHDLKDYHSSHDGSYCVWMRSIIIFYPSTHSTHSYLPPWYVSGRDHKQPIHLGGIPCPWQMPSGSDGMRLDVLVNNPSNWVTTFICPGKPSLARHYKFAAVVKAMPIQQWRLSVELHTFSLIVTLSDALGNNVKRQACSFVEQHRYIGSLPIFHHVNGRQLSKVVVSKQLFSWWIVQPLTDCNVTTVGIILPHPFMMYVCVCVCGRFA